MKLAARSLLRLAVAIGVLFFVLPAAALLINAPWSQLWEHLTDQASLEALRLSMLCSLAAALACLLIGLPLAAWLARAERSLLRAIVRVLVTLPLVLPPVVGGIALLMAYGRRGILGAGLDEVFAYALPFSSGGAILAATYVGMPFFVLSVEGGIRNLDPSHEETAATLGASAARRFLTITLPLATPAIVAGLVLAWARALGEFGATITFAGNLRGATRTMPLEVFAAFERAPERAISLSLVMVSIAAVVLFTLRHRCFPQQ